ncbi:MAG: arsenite efflux transporter metallochaperone ArsD [Candidatus Atribacteria bacterium]|nr:arsenite efflux transporter metallochaperone ArsD [Candidatus Atribacteria bacterium]
MSRLQVFDPPMCCSTGICGPSVDPALPRFTADLKWLTEQGIKVERYNLSQQPEAFVSNPIVKAVLETDGDTCLPLVLINDRIVGKGYYPTREELANLLSFRKEQKPSFFTDAVAELVAVGASIAANCEVCLLYHYKRALQLGISHDDLAQAVTMAQRVKETPNKRLLALAESLQECEENPNKPSSHPQSNSCGPQTLGSGCCG